MGEFLVSTARTGYQIGVTIEDHRASDFVDETVAMDPTLGGRTPGCAERPRHRRLIGAKRAVTQEEWARIRQEYYADHHSIREIAREEGIRRTVIRAIVCPWPE
jgi:hypothetical protein